MKVLQSYMDYQRLNARLKIARENLDEHQRLFDLISRRQQQQVTSEADVALAKARVQQVRTELAAMLSTQRNARLSLEQLTGQVFVDAVLLEEPADRAKVWSDEFAAQTAAREASPLLQRLMAEVRLNEADVNNRKTLVLPQLNLRHERFLGSAAVVPFDRTMVVLQYQPGSGASVLPGIDAAVKRIGSAQFAYEAGARELAEKVSAQLNEVASLTGQLDFTRQYVESSQEVMASYLRQYTAARKTWIEVLNAQRELAQARYTAIDTTYGLKLAFYKLDILTGVIHKSPPHEMMHDTLTW
jgi:adhesin transport system outer membrane protein